ncbi:MAG: DUF1836 domain-containing protein [Clostridiales bacterium]|jgi:DNA-binding transcriptional MerR regulator|nr:DUF1836 domain-containing protein [Clostridiales bacterium]
MADLIDSIQDVLSKFPPRRDLLRDVMSYNDSMTISQVIKFFERQGVVFTKPMIQHYVKVGALPPPEDKRRYTRLHLLRLAVLQQLKEIYSLENIAAAFSGLAPVDDTLIKRFQSLAEYAAATWRETLPGLADKAAETANSMKLGEDETQKLFESLIILSIMTQSASAEQMARMLIAGANE